MWPLTLISQLQARLKQSLFLVYQLFHLKTRVVTKNWVKTWTLSLVVSQYVRNTCSRKDVFKHTHASLLSCQGKPDFLQFSFESTESQCLRANHWTFSLLISAAHNGKRRGWDSGLCFRSGGISLRPVAQKQSKENGPSLVAVSEPQHGFLGNEAGLWQCLWEWVTGQTQWLLTRALFHYSDWKWHSSAGRRWCKP